MSMDMSEFAARYVFRAQNLKATRGAPPDARLPRFVRERFMVLGRRSERAACESGPALDVGVNLAYVSCEPGKGFCSHKHPDWEIFVVLSGRWKIEVADAQIEVGPKDVVAVPGDVYHAAVNACDETSFMMSINMGNDTARYTIHPSVLEELGLPAP
jgi:mannose-6-phosphate isomerase-like protein (cupin superfamily)